MFGRDREALRRRSGCSVSALHETYDATGRRTGSVSFEEFSRGLERVNQPGHRALVNFSRKPLFGGLGGGHYCPVGAFLPSTDLSGGMVLLLDVNDLPDYRFYSSGKPFLVTARDLYAASVRTLDPQSGQGRGLLILTRNPVDSGDATAASREPGRVGS